MNQPCYRYRYASYRDKPLFDAQTVGAAYVLIMEHSDQEDDMQEQLDFHRPAENVVVQYNRGFRACSKPDLLQSKIAFDLAHAYYTAFRHALDRGHPRVLVFEEDFFLENYTPKDVACISQFLREHDPDVYSLGMLQFLYGRWKNQGPHMRALGPMYCSHAVVYSRRYMQHYVAAYRTQPQQFLRVNGHVDRVWSQLTDQRYMYFKPIAFQLVRLSDNMKDYSGAYHRMLVQLFQLEKHNKRWCDVMLNAYTLQTFLHPAVITLHALLCLAVGAAGVLLALKRIPAWGFGLVCGLGAVLVGATLLYGWWTCKKNRFACQYHPRANPGQAARAQPVILQSFTRFLKERMRHVYTTLAYRDGVACVTDEAGTRALRALILDYDRHRFRVRNEETLPDPTTPYRSVLHLYKLGLPAELKVYTLKTYTQKKN